VRLQELSNGIDVPAVKVAAVAAALNSWRGCHLYCFTRMPLSHLFVDLANSSYE
jgi:hypothetical protein